MGRLLRAGVGVPRGRSGGGVEASVLGLVLRRVRTPEALSGISTSCPQPGQEARFCSPSCVIFIRCPQCEHKNANIDKALRQVRAGPPCPASHIVPVSVRAFKAAAQPRREPRIAEVSRDSPRCPGRWQGHKSRRGIDEPSGAAKMPGEPGQQTT